MADPVLKKLHVWKESENKQEWSEIADQGLEVKYIWQMWDLLCIRAGVLYRRWENLNGKEIKFLLVVPKSLENFILSQVHDSTTGAHIGVSKAHLKLENVSFGML